MIFRHRKNPGTNPRVSEPPLEPAGEAGFAGAARWQHAAWKLGCDVAAVKAGHDGLPIEDAEAAEWIDTEEMAAYVYLGHDEFMRWVGVGHDDWTATR